MIFLYQFSDLPSFLFIPPEHEETGLELTKKLITSAIVVAGGHSGSFADQFYKAIEAGRSLGVHFLNGPSRSSSKGFRDGGAVEAMLRSDAVSLEIIGDGYHVAAADFRDVIKRKGIDKIIE